MVEYGQEIDPNLHPDGWIPEWRCELGYRNHKENEHTWDPFF